MTRSRLTILTLLCLTVILTTLPAPAALAWNRGAATRFALLPAGAGNPESLTADAQGNLYVTTFTGVLHVFDRNGRLRRSVTVASASPLLLDLAFHPRTGALLVVDFGAQQILDVDPYTGTASVFATIPGGAAAGPNVLQFDRDGNVYISDSFQGTIWRTGPNGGAVTAWVNSPLLRTDGYPPFGANGMAFNAAQDSMFVANTGDDSIVRIPVDADGNAGTPQLFVYGVNGPDGMIIDEHDNLWVAANQSDEIVVIDPSGRMLAKLGDFSGIDRQGAVTGLLFPSSLVRVGKFIYVSNFALDTRTLGLPGGISSAWAAQVRRHSIARLRADIPPLTP